MATPKFIFNKIELTVHTILLSSNVQSAILESQQYKLATIHFLNTQGEITQTYRI